MELKNTTVKRINYTQTSRFDLFKCLLAYYIVTTVNYRMSQIKAYWEFPLVRGDHRAQLLLRPCNILSTKGKSCPATIGERIVV